MDPARLELRVGLFTTAGPSSLPNDGVNGVPSSEPGFLSTQSSGLGFLPPSGHARTNPFSQPSLIGITIGVIHNRRSILTTKRWGQWGPIF
ncbi:hypothetical protein PGTUg99_029951 [Puccinia graminis f. sp. tritici]|uniref:Uncharacterized protein n=1 Tax=Puccinia graminis f. sp. tritici TaxID=56615 RepID=A0A5B0R872_PUCGR|nr:hypothetical protein PGTUg99_029951 [Puccinia graminis f. sp. tritici]